MEHYFRNSDGGRICASCGKVIAKGEPIVWRRGCTAVRIQVWHRDCPEPGPDRIKESERFIRF